MLVEVLFLLGAMGFGFALGHCSGFVTGVNFSQKRCVEKRQYPTPTPNEITARLLDES